MSASPFRSHLLQQWARSSQGRAPAAVVTWLKAPADSSTEVEGKCQDNGVSSQVNHEYLQAPSVSTLDSAPYASSSTCWETSLNAYGQGGATHPSLRPERTNTRQASARTFTGASTANDRTILQSPSPVIRKHYTREEKSSTSRGKRLLSSGGSQRHDAFDGQRGSNGGNQVNLEVASSHMTSQSMTTAFQALLMNRRTATRWKGGAHDGNSSFAEQRLIEALDRAVECAQMAPNHKRTEPFSFRRFLKGSKTAQDLADISYNVTLRKNGSEPDARAKRHKWLEIPGFLVILVHDNQSDEDSQGPSQTDTYELLRYSPPETERQLEDYASACAAAQNVLLSLFAEGIGSKWATGPVIRTPAFRDLVHAQTSDRVVALIMVGGSTEFESDREEKITAVRRHRRRSIHGDLLQDLI